MKHSFLPPSGAYAWGVCAQWPLMNARYPQDDSPESVEGTAAHWVAFEPFNGTKITAGMTAPNGIVVTEEMIEGGELLAEAVGDRIAGMESLHIEETVPISFIDPDCFGTPDVWASGMGNFDVEIIDYKFGHRFVDEFFNPQGLLYLLGILEKLHIPWETDKSVSVGFTIVQPRCYYKGSPIRTHEFRVSEAEPLFYALREAAKLARGSNPAAKTNPACSNCPGRHSCQALQMGAYSDAEFATDRQPFDLTPGAAALELRILERAYDRLGARVDGLRELTLANLKRGEKIPYFHIEEGKGRSEWNLPIDQVITMGQLFGKDLAKPGVITPNQAKKAGIDENVIKAYSFVPSGNLKLVADNPADARRVFGKGE